MTNTVLSNAGSGREQEAAQAAFLALMARVSEIGKPEDVVYAAIGFIGTQLCWLTQHMSG